MTFAKTRPFLLGLIMTFTIVFSAIAPAHAANDRSSRVNVFRDWGVYVFTEQGAKVCYIASQPTKSEGNYKQRDDAFAFITHRPQAGEFNVISFLSGYTHRKDSTVSVAIDGKTYTLFTLEDRAWTKDAASDAELLAAMKKGNRMIVKGVSARGTETTDTYSLMGFTKALAAIDQQCR